MVNMSYCRFRNTLPTLKDCYDNLWDKCTDPEEERARKRIIALCKRIAQEAKDNEQ